MKELLILRHAKSSWDSPTLDDHDRPLNKRGLRDAPRMGELIREKGCVPDHVICSTAERTRQTVHYVCEGCKFGGDVEFLETLYGTSTEAYIRIIRGVRDDVGRLMVVGHNPTLEDLVSELSGEDHRFPTAALAYFRVSIKHWKDLSRESEAELMDLWRPKDLWGKDES